MNSKQLRFAVLIAGRRRGERLRPVQNRSKPRDSGARRRIAVLTTETDVAIDPATAALPMNLPAPVANAEWAQSGGNASKSMGHVALGGSIARPGRFRSARARR
jgi:outer membrane protein assembly factor BamB